MEVVYGIEIFKMAAVAMETQKRRENYKCSEFDKSLQKCCLALWKLKISLLYYQWEVWETFCIRENTVTPSYYYYLLLLFFCLPP